MDRRHYQEQISTSSPWNYNRGGSDQPQPPDNYRNRHDSSLAYATPSLFPSAVYPFFDSNIHDSTSSFNEGEQTSTPNQDDTSSLDLLASVSAIAFTQRSVPLTPNPPSSSTSPGPPESATLTPLLPMQPIYPTITNTNTVNSTVTICQTVNHKTGYFRPWYNSVHQQTTHFRPPPSPISSHCFTSSALYNNANQGPGTHQLVPYPPIISSPGLFVPSSKSPSNYSQDKPSWKSMQETFHGYFDDPANPGMHQRPPPTTSNEDYFYANNSITLSKFPEHPNFSVSSSHATLYSSVHSVTLQKQMKEGLSHIMCKNKTKTKAKPKTSSLKPPVLKHRLLSSTNTKATKKGKKGPKMGKTKAQDSNFSTPNSKPLLTLVGSQESTLPSIVVDIKNCPYEINVNSVAAKDVKNGDPPSLPKRRRSKLKAHKILPTQDSKAQPSIVENQTTNSKNGLLEVDVKPKTTEMFTYVAPPPKKRGRKPGKSKLKSSFPIQSPEASNTHFGTLHANTPHSSTLDIQNSPLEADFKPMTTDGTFNALPSLPKKRGRKPGKWKLHKYTPLQSTKATLAMVVPQDIGVPSTKTSPLGINVNSQIVEGKAYECPPPLPKKRGRKPKQFKLNNNFPVQNLKSPLTIVSECPSTVADTEDCPVKEDVKPVIAGATTYNAIAPPPKKRGRKPGKFKLHNALHAQNSKSSLTMINAIDSSAPSIIFDTESYPVKANANPMPSEGISYDVFPPPPKKRGRKPGKWKIHRHLPIQSTKPAVALVCTQDSEIPCSMTDTEDCLLEVNVETQTAENAPGDISPPSSPKRRGRPPKKLHWKTKLKIEQMHDSSF